MIHLSGIEFRRLKLHMRENEPCKVSDVGCDYQLFANDMSCSIVGKIIAVNLKTNVMTVEFSHDMWSKYLIWHTEYSKRIRHKIIEALGVPKEIIMLKRPNPEVEAEQIESMVTRIIDAKITNGAE